MTGNRSSGSTVQQPSGPRREHTPSCKGPPAWDVSQRARHDAEGYSSEGFAAQWTLGQARAHVNDTDWMLTAVLKPADARGIGLTPFGIPFVT